MLELFFDDLVFEENLEMMIDLVEEEEEREIQVLLGDYLDNSDSDIEMNSSATSSTTTISSFSSLSTCSLSHDLDDLEDEIEDIVLEGIDFLQVRAFTFQKGL